MRFVHGHAPADAGFPVCLVARRPAALRSASVAGMMVKLNLSWQINAPIALLPAFSLRACLVKSYSTNARRQDRRRPYSDPESCLDDPRKSPSGPCPPRFLDDPLHCPVYPPSPDRAILIIGRRIFPVRLVGEYLVIGNGIAPRPPHLPQKQPRKASCLLQHTLLLVVHIQQVQVSRASGKDLAPARQQAPQDRAPKGLNSNARHGPWGS